MLKFAPLEQGSIITLITTDAHQHMRLDIFVSTAYDGGYSRSFFKKIIDAGHIEIDGKVISKSGFKLHAGQTIVIHVPSTPNQAIINEEAHKLPIEIVFSHEHFLILNKPPHVLVHSPGKNNTEPTVVDWLLTHFSEIKTVGAADRAGIVHRLDKDTSGLLLVARNPYAHAILSDLFKNRCISKSYLAVVNGHPEREGIIDFNITRHPVDRKRMTHSTLRGRTALTHYCVQEFFKNTSLIEARPVTGRTHQIRVHCAAMGHPIIGDQVYYKLSPLIQRQALHAYKLAFTFEGQNYSFCQDPPADFQELLTKLRQQ